VREFLERKWRPVVENDETGQVREQVFTSARFDIEVVFRDLVCYDLQDICRAMKTCRCVVFGVNR